VCQRYVINKGGPEEKDLQVLIARTEGAFGQGDIRFSNFCNLHTIHFEGVSKVQAEKKGPEHGSCNLSVRGSPVVLHLLVELSD
jgi:hypothetical protein